MSKHRTFAGRCDGCGRCIYTDEDRFYVDICGHEFKMCAHCVSHIPAEEEQKDEDES